MHFGPVLKIPEFCQRNGIGRSTFYYLRKIGRGPVEMRIGARVVITQEAETLWRVRMIEDPIEGGVRPAADLRKEI